MQIKKSSDEIINEIAEALRNTDGDLIAKIANMVLIPHISYDGDSIFIQEIEE